MKSLDLFALIALSCVSLAAYAQTATAWQRPILPDSATYYDPSQGGTGLNVDVDPNGYIFATLFAYGEDGDPWFYAMQGTFEPAYDIAESGMIGTLDAQMYISKNGECVGEGCTYKTPERTLTELEAHIVWSTTRRATLTIGSQTWDMHAAQLTVPNIDRIVGTWVATITDREMADGGLGSRIAVLRIVPIEAGQNPGYSLTYDLTCASATGAAGPLATACPELFAYLADGATGVDGFGIIYYYDGFGGMKLAPYRLGDGDEPYFLGPNHGMRYELELTSGVMRGRSMIISDTGDYETRRSTIDMLRVPDGTYEVPLGQPTE